MSSGIVGDALRVAVLGGGPPWREAPRKPLGALLGALASSHWNLAGGARGKNGHVASTSWDRIETSELLPVRAAARRALERDQLEALQDAGQRRHLRFQLESQERTARLPV